MIQDIFSGTTMQRPGWLKLMQKVEKGEVTDIYMEELSRMARTKEEGFKEWMQLYEKNIELHFLKQPQVDTATFRNAVNRSIKINTDNVDNATKDLMESIVGSINKYMIELAKQQIFNVFDEAQFERDMLSQRTAEGLVVARLNGKQVGRQKGAVITTKKQKKAKKKMLDYYEKYGGQLSATDCMKVCEVSRDSFYAYIKQLENDAKKNA